MVIWMAIALHLGQGTAVIIDDSATNVTSIHLLQVMTGNHFVTGGLMIAVALLAVTGLLLRYRISTPDRVLLLGFQQALLFISAWGCVVAIYEGQYADEVVRSRFFIFPDQYAVILTMLFHTFSIVSEARNG